MMDKASVRHGILAARDALTREERLVKSSAIGLRLSEQVEYIEAGTILFYLNFRSEAATRKMIETALTAGKKVLLPKVDRKAHRLKLFEVKDLAADLEAGYMGIYEPVEGVALVIMPGVGFDTAGRRLGYGGGYYDRLIETLRPDAKLIALAFDAQVVDEIPAEEHDKKVGKIITETRVITS
jgi:5-formyltetrahydrofolate cyclo-ligase